jgi:hypothetical protein
MPKAQTIRRQDQIGGLLMCDRGGAMNLQRENLPASNVRTLE